MATAALYTPEVLGLAAWLAQCPLHEGLALRGAARSASCGSALTLGLRLDAQGRIAEIGISASVCAIGQAAAALFAQGARGRKTDDIAAAERAITAWLAGAAGGGGGGPAAPMPGWPGLGAIAAAAAYPARHGAILLGWRAALQALASHEAGVA